MSQETNDQSGMQADPPRKLEAGFTAEPPARAIARRPRSRWLLPVLILFALLAVAALAVAGVARILRYANGGYPTTPMTVEQAERMANEGPPAGSTQQEVIAWLESRGIMSWTAGKPGAWYYAKRRLQNGTFGRWDGDPESGKEAVVEDAGLKVDDVNSIVMVDYHDAARTSNGYDEVLIYFFYDGHDLLIMHWVVLRHVGVSGHV